MFIMCGAVITTGGLFLFVMNVYNYHLIDKKRRKAKDQERPGEDLRALEHMPEESPQAPGREEAETGPEATEEDAAMGDDFKTGADAPCQESPEFHDVSI